MNAERDRRGRVSSEHAESLTISDGGQFAYRPLQPLERPVTAALIA